ncbi:MAG: DUF3021 family protein [Clostridiaceae bacterium]|nr:DUF3021 family protein [Clostridiaceae bacterium]
MDTNRTLYDYMRQVFVIFGFTIGFLCIICLLFGESARTYSSMFSLGNDGLKISTIGQFFLVSVIITALRFLFFSDKIIKKLSLTKRTIFMFVSVFFLLVVCVIIFDWFPIGDWLPWIGFLLSFGLSVGVSYVVMSQREKSENARMEIALQRYKKENPDHD